MFPILLLLFIVMPIAEIALILEVGENLGGWNTLGLVILTAIVGASLVKSQGVQTWFNVHQRVQAGELPGQQIIEGVLLLVAGVLLVTPGFITDLFGIIIVTPLFRPAIAKSLMSRLNVQIVAKSNFQSGNFRQANVDDDFTSDRFNQHNHTDDKSDAKPGEIIEGEFKRKDKN